MTIHDRYRAIARQICVLEAAYPGLTEINELWYFLPFGRPDGISRDARYILFIYRAALDARETMRTQYVASRAERHIAALDAEAAFAWEAEHNHLAPPLARIIPVVPEFASLTSMFALAA